MLRACHGRELLLKTARFGLMFAVVFTSVACGDGELTVDYPEVSADRMMTIASALRPSERRARVTMIRDAARAHGLNNGWLLAGIADVETNLAHCWSEARWACKGPASSSCEGGPVIAGSADGPCSHEQGGLGMFQFDAGTYSQTLAREGREILTIEGNTQAAIDFVVDKVRISDFISGVSTNAEALAWMNRLQPDTVHYDQWVKTITGYYNGCFEGRCSKYHSQYNKYDTRTRNVLNEFGPDFWGTTSVSAPATGGAVASTGTPAAARDLSPGTAHVDGGNGISLRWTAAGATRFVIRAEYRATDGWRHYWEWTRNSSVMEMWPQVPNTEYRWTVQACNANGCANWSDYASFTYGNATSSTPTTGTASTGGSSGSSTSGSGTTNTGTSTGTSGTGSSTGSSGTTAAEPDTTDTSNGESTSTQPAPQSSGAPGMPASMSPAGIYIETPDVPLTWSEPAGAESFDIVMYYFDGTDWTDYHVWERKRGGAFTVWPVVDDTYYAWAIRACNGMGCSDWSDFQQFYFGPL